MAVEVEAPSRVLLLAGLERLELERLARRVQGTHLSERATITREGGGGLARVELHTPDQAAARAFYLLLLRWRPELIEARSGSYLSLDLGGWLAGGIVECGTQPPLSGFPTSRSTVSTRSSDLES